MGSLRPILHFRVHSCIFKLHVSLSVDSGSFCSSSNHTLLDMIGKSS